MKTLLIGAGPLGCLYTYLLHKGGKDITILARNKQYDFIKNNGIIIVNEYTKKKYVSEVKVINKLGENDSFDLVIVIMGRDKILSLLPELAKKKKLKNILFMGNNVSGFDEYLKHLPEEKILFGFPGAGGTRKEGIVYYVDSEKEEAKRFPVVIGEIDGKIKSRTKEIISLFNTSGIPVNYITNIDGWLKYHGANVLPLFGGLYKYDYDIKKLAGDKSTLKLIIKVLKELGNILKASGYKKRQPFKYNLYYVIPEAILIKILQKLLLTKFAEVAFKLHAEHGYNEFKEIVEFFNMMNKNVKLKTPNFDKMLQMILKK